MEREITAPETLQEAILFFSNYENCHKTVIAMRWPDGVVRCPTCGSDHVTYLATQRRWKCYGKHQKAQFSLKVGTIFEDSPLPLQKWLPALWLLTNSKNGISSYELARALGVTQPTAWFMLSRLRLALQSEHGVSSVPLPGRTSVSFQQPQDVRRGTLYCCAQRYHRQTSHLYRADRLGVAANVLKNHCPN